MRTDHTSRMIEGFTDIHCHILPGLDDGPETMDQSLKMLEIARRDGVATIVATPHIKQAVYDTKKSDIEKGVALLKEKTDGPDILMGADVSISVRLMSDIKSGGIPFLNGKNYLLLEFPAFSIPPMDYIDELISLLGQLNIYPILSHPERHAIIVNNIKFLKDLVDKGIYCQVTAMSITGEFGREVQKFTKKLFKNGLVHVVATDAHSVEKRPPILSKAYHQIVKEFNEDVARMVFITNPQIIVQGERID